MLTEADTPSRLQPPTSVLVDCLAALPLHQSETVSVSAVVKLLDVLQTAVSAPRKTDKELLSLLVVILRLAQNKTPAPASELSSHILPSPSDRVTPLGQGSSLPHRLLKLCSATVEPEVREVISSIYFELSDSNPQRFVHHVGFGNAAGFLASRGIQVSQEELTRHQEQANDADINPVTGQLCSEEARVEVPVMTQEEKEREAERLFVLFERSVPVFNLVSLLTLPGCARMVQSALRTQWHSSSSLVGLRSFLMTSLDVGDEASIGMRRRQGYALSLIGRQGNW